LRAAAKRLTFEGVAQIRDRVQELRGQQISRACPAGDEECHGRLLL
jgi:hypothetical protein